VAGPTAWSWAGILTPAARGLEEPEPSQGEKFVRLVATHAIFGNDWDKPELDDGGFDQLYALAVAEEAAAKDR